MKARHALLSAVAAAATLASVAVASHATVHQASLTPTRSDGLTWAEYRTRSGAICQAATSRFYAAIDKLGDGPAYYRTSARMSAETLAKLRLLPAPPLAYRARVESDYALRGREIDVLRQAAAAASVGNAARTRTLNAQRIRLTHRRANGSGHLPAACPVDLPA